MKLYRETSSDDEKAWELTKERELFYHIIFLLFLFIIFIFFAGVFIFSS